MEEKEQPINISIDGKPLLTGKGSILIDVCRNNGFKIPRFCYHPKLNVAGNCRMCMVKVKINDQERMQASCTIIVQPGMEITTNDDEIANTRKWILKFLLMNHPLDCPICDQGGECDLQDQVLRYGIPYSEYHGSKRVFEDKLQSNFISTFMNRCIHCMRCIRFLNDIAGDTNGLISINRGVDTEVTIFENSLSTNLSGNIVDLCPVGALSFKPSLYSSRPWELASTPSIDVMDAMGSNIYIQHLGNKILKIAPRNNSSLNDEWLADTSRFVVDYLCQNRIDKPYIMVNDNLQSCNWSIAINTVVNLIKSTDPTRIAIILGDFIDCESLYMVKMITTILGCQNIVTEQRGPSFIDDLSALYLFNTKIKNIENSDLILLIGVNLEKDITLINTKIRKAVNKGSKVFLLGNKVDLKYKYESLGDDLAALTAILHTKHKINEDISHASKPAIIVGNAVFLRDDYREIIHLILQICHKFNFIQENWNGFNVLHTKCSTVGMLLTGMFNRENYISSLEVKEKIKAKAIDLVYVIGKPDIDEYSLSSYGRNDLSPTATIDKQKTSKISTIYQGSHGNEFIKKAAVILPSSCYVEKKSTYVNLEGRIQTTQKAVKPPGNAKEDHIILHKIYSQLCSKDHTIIDRNDICYKAILNIEQTLKAKETISTEKILFNPDNIDFNKKVIIPE